VRRRMAIALVLCAVAACGQSPEPSPTGQTPEPSLTGQTPEPSLTGQPIVVEGRNAGFALSMRIGSDVVDAGAPIDISAILVWEGAEPSATIWGSGSGPVSFGLKEIGGDLEMGGAMTLDCAMRDFVRLVPEAIPYHKSGGFTGEDPNAAFYRTFFADPVLRLPAGRWKVTAIADGYLAPCAMEAPSVGIALEAEILVR
jgi:hypothetical protein